MKKFTYFILFSVVILSTYCISSCSEISGNNASESRNTIPEILDRRFSVGQDEEREQLLTDYDNAIISLQQNPQNLNSLITLAAVFNKEARITGDIGYYQTAAIEMTNRVLQSGTEDKDLIFQALTLQSGSLLSMHQFKDARDAALRAYAISSHNAQLLGALVDAELELGNYQQAVKYCDEMIQLRPDIRSYSRVSYLRQIHGDNAGAIEAMKMAVESGVPGSEAAEWARLTLGDLYLMTGELDKAEANYKTALQLRKNYAYAYAALGRLEKMKNNYEEAIRQTENAIRISSDVAFVSQLADLYELSGNLNKATQIRKDIVRLLEENEIKQSGNSIQHNSARELATAYAKAGDYDKALEYAIKDRQFRPENIDANELLAWIYFLKNDPEHAQVYADKMLSTRTMNPTTLYKAGLIYRRSGDEERSRECIQLALIAGNQIDPQLISLYH